MTAWRRAGAGSAWRPPAGRSRPRAGAAGAGGGRGRGGVQPHQGHRAVQTHEERREGEARAAEANGPGLSGWVELNEIRHELKFNKVVLSVSSGEK